MTLQVQFLSRSYALVVNALQERFPYRKGDYFDQVVTGPRAPLPYNFAYIHLASPLSADQIVFLEHSKQAGLIAQYDVS